MSQNYKTNKEQNEKHRRILNGLLRDPDNKECADCTAKGPRWASTNLGVFICMKCSGIHRHLGVHISKVRSVTLDSWTPEQVATIQRVGNKRAKEVYEAYVPSHRSKPAETDDTRIIEDWIRAKYERLEFVDKKAYKELKGEMNGGKKKKSSSKTNSSTSRSNRKKKRSTQPSSHDRQESTSSASSESNSLSSKNRSSGSRSTPSSPVSRRSNHKHTTTTESNTGGDDLLSFDGGSDATIAKNQNHAEAATSSTIINELFGGGSKQGNEAADQSDFHKSASTPNLNTADPKENLHETILSLFNNPSTASSTSSSSPSNNTGSMPPQGMPPGYPSVPQQQYPYPPPYPPMQQPPPQPYGAAAPPQYPGAPPTMQYPAAPYRGNAVAPNGQTRQSPPTRETYPHSHSSFF
eukprot:gb/GECH01006700.1/.p1 GENE.gb/GECH01006700.1/~~gb/GECH01006700.1/.p1  ORF type:complete len:408 (+),score=82.80 gb/GECH01006700.1/:1-1224(+)